MHTLLYCFDAANLSVGRPPVDVQDTSVGDTGSTASWRNNTTDVERQWTADQRSAVERRATEVVYLVVRYYVYQGVTPAIMLAGVVGNLISLVLGVRCRRQKSSLERSASAGLIALLSSDLLFCAVGLPQLFVPERSDPWTPGRSVSGARFGFYYELYRGPLHNVFLLCSTWIVAIITAERYVAVSRPIRARFLMIRLHRTLLFYAGVFSLAAVVALPLFLKYRAVEGDCLPGCRCLYVVPTSTFGSVKWRRGYNVAWTLVGVVLPLGCLLVAGIKLVQVLRARLPRNDASTAGRQVHQHRHHHQHRRPSPVTTTVVGTAVSFILLVCPSIVVES